MKAVLLAAGVGSRLRPLTDSTPKCMVPVGGKPVLQHNVEWLAANGVTELAVNLHHRPGVVTEFLGSGERFGVSVRFSYEPQLLGTAGAILPLRSWLGDEDFLVVYADNIIRCDLGALGERHRTFAATVTVALYWRADVGASGVAEMAPDDRIIRFVEKPRPNQTSSHWVAAGLMHCSPRVLRFIPSSGASDFGYGVLPALLAAGEPIVGYRMGPSESLVWIDTVEDLAAAEDALRQEGLTR